MYDPEDGTKIEPGISFVDPTVSKSSGYRNGVVVMEGEVPKTEEGTERDVFSSHGSANFQTTGWKNGGYLIQTCYSTYANIFPSKAAIVMAKVLSYVTFRHFSLLANIVS